MKKRNPKLFFLLFHKGYQLDFVTSCMDDPSTQYQCAQSALLKRWAFVALFIIVILDNYCMVIFDIDYYIAVDLHHKLLNIKLQSLLVFLLPTSNIKFYPTSFNSIFFIVF